MSYPDAAWERAMTVQEVILKALSGEIHWFQAADILGFRRAAYVGGGTGTRGMAMWVSSINGGIRPPYGGSRRRRSSGCCGSIGSGIAGSMSGTFIRWPSASMA